MTDADTIARALLDGIRQTPQRLPDHPIRNSRAYQIYVRLARPTLMWVANFGAAYALFLGHWVGRPMDPIYAGVSLTFVATLYGLKGVEKIKGVT